MERHMAGSHFLFGAASGLAAVIKTLKRIASADY